MSDLCPGVVSNGIAQRTHSKGASMMAATRNRRSCALLAALAAFCKGTELDGRVPWASNAMTSRPSNPVVEVVLNN